MSPCENCGDCIESTAVASVVADLRELTAEDFNLCATCIHIESDACTRCDGDVYVPRTEDATPTLCPACRYDLIQETGDDPGWEPSSRTGAELS